jgi:hypothetical protein
MFYEFDLTVTADTARADPATLEVALNAGTITQVAIQFPAGCSGMVYVSIWRSDHQLWPGDPDEAIAGEDSIVSWAESYDLDDQPFSLLLKAWSPGTTYPHKLTFRFALLSLEESQGIRQAPGLLGRLANLLLGRP